MELIENRLYDFMGKRKLWLTISAVLCAAMVAVVALKGQKVLGYELRGADIVSLTGVPGATEDAVRTAQESGGGDGRSEAHRHGFMEIHGEGRIGAGSRQCQCEYGEAPHG